MQTIHEEKWAKDIKRQFKKKINYKWLKMLIDAQFQSFFLSRLKTRYHFSFSRITKKKTRLVILSVSKDVMKRYFHFLLLGT